jgi:serine/threonine protein kinase
MHSKPAYYQKNNHKSNYYQLGLIGQGQFGQVFCGIHRKSGKLVALKDLHPQRFPTHKFLRELRILMTLRHPNIVSCQGIEHHEKGRYLVMDYCEGGTLRDLMESQGKLNIILTLRLIKNILGGLAEAHKKDIIHCDLKPENILLKLTAHSWIALITDFGVARLLKEEGGSSSGLGDTGSPAYMAPERYYGKYSPSSDLYAVGVILFELIVGKRPFSGLPGELMTAHLSQPVIIPSSVPEIISMIIKKGMEKLISRRYTSALEMLEDVKKAENILQKDISSFPRFSPPSLEVLTETLAILARKNLGQSVIDLTVIENRLYLGMKNEIITYIYEKEILISNLKQQWKINLKTDFIGFKSSSNHCYGLVETQSQDNYGLYCFPNDPEIKPVQMLSGIGDKFINTIEDKGYWCATIEKLDNQTYLKIKNVYHKTPFKIKLPHSNPQQIIPLNSYYGILFIPTKEKETQGKIFTRKGKFIYSINLPIKINNLISHLTKDYHYFALDEKETNLGFLIDFKPYRLLSISLGIKPDFIVSIPQGFALFNKDGEGVILDQDGQQSDTFKLPIKPLAIKSCGETHLLIVAEEENEITLLLSDYKQIIKDELD